MKGNNVNLQLEKQLHENLKKKKSIKQAVIDFQVQKGDDYTHEVTLTFPKQPKTRWYAEKDYAKFQKFLIERCYKRKDKERIKMAVMLEGELKDNLHYHCALRCPKHMSNAKFANRIAKTWKDVVGNKSARVKIKKYTDKGWLSYSAKEVSFNNTDVFSENNVCDI